MQKVKIVTASKDNLHALRLFMKLEWMRLTNMVVGEGISKQIGQSALSEQVISLATSYQAADFPILEAFRETEIFEKDSASFTINELQCKGLLEIIKNKFSVKSGDPNSKDTADWIATCRFLDEQREELNDILNEAQDSFSYEEKPDPSISKYKSVVAKDTKFLN